VARPTIKGEMHGLLTTLQSGKGAHLSPVATPIVLKLMKAGEKVAFGRIPPGHAAYAKYAGLLKRTLDEQFSYKEKSDLISINLETGLTDDKSFIVTDGIKLIQILSNLINNATKFTREGRIDFGYKLKDGNLEFFVKDTGIGIPQEHHEKIFERFFQVDNLISRKFGGTGLGLSICKAYVELLGGRIWVISNPGEGTDFRFTIPYDSPQKQKLKEKDKEKERKSPII